MSLLPGYIFENGIPEWGVAVAMALAGFTGIIGTFLFTRLRRWIGLERTGLFAFAAEIVCLTLCVASIFLPGTLFSFAHTYLNVTEAACSPEDSAPDIMINETYETLNRTLRSVSPDFEIPLSQFSYDHVLRWGSPGEAHSIVRRSVEEVINSTTNSTAEKCKQSHSLVSITVFLVGIITSRVGELKEKLTRENECLFKNFT